MSETSGQASLSAVPLSLSNAIPKYFDLKSERSYNVLHGQLNIPSVFLEH